MDGNRSMTYQKFYYQVVIQSINNNDGHFCLMEAGKPFRLLFLCRRAGGTAAVAYAIITKVEAGGEGYLLRVTMQIVKGAEGVPEGVKCGRTVTLGFRVHQPDERGRYPYLFCTELPPELFEEGGPEGV